MKCINEMKLQLSSRSSNEGFARVAVAAFLAQYDPTLDELSDIKTAVSEAVTNCIVHAYRTCMGRIYIQVRVMETMRVEITIRDRGCGIEDIKKAIEPMYTTDAVNERAGLGFTVMQTFMDKLSVKSKPGSGTTVKLIKTLTSKE